MSSSQVLTTRGAQTDRQAATVERLAEATIDELRASGYDGLTVRNVAKRAGVAPATAYTYFASKEHLATEVFWRRVQDFGPLKVDSRKAPSKRVADALAPYWDLAATDRELVAACTVAMLADDTGVQHVRDKIGADMRQRIVTAIGDDGDRSVIRAVELALTGALMRAGMGHLPYDQIGARMAEVTALLVERNR